MFYIILLLLSCGFRDDSQESDDKSRAAVPVIQEYVVANGKDEYKFDLPEDSILLDSSQEQVKKPVFSTEQVGDYLFYASKDNKEVKKWKIKARFNVEHNERRSKFSNAPLTMKESIPVQLSFKGEEFSLSQLKDIAEDNIELIMNLHGHEVGKVILSLHAYSLAIKRDGKLFSNLNTLDNGWELVIKNGDEVLNNGFNIEGIDLNNTKFGRYTIFANIGQDVTNKVKLHLYPNMGDIVAQDILAGSFREIDMSDLGNFKVEDIKIRDDIILIDDNKKRYLVPLKAENFKSRLDITIDDFKVGSLNIHVKSGVNYTEPNEHWPGLPNRGNTCFANATFSALAATKYVDYSHSTNKVAQYLQTILNSKRLGEESLANVRSVAAAMIDNFKIIFNAESRASASVVEIKNNTYMKICGRQEDANDFIGGIIKVLNVSKNNKEIHQLTPFNQLEVSSVVYNEKGQLATSRSDPFNIISLNGTAKNADEVWDMQSKVDEFFSEETLEASEILFDYPDANNKRMLPTALPKLLIVQLKRFAYHWNKATKKATSFKLSNKVKVDEELDLDYYNVNQTNLKNPEKAGSKKYRVRSIICHSGSLSGGHYWAYVRGDNNWYRHDDANVTPITEQQALNGSEQYIILYEEIE